MKYLDTLNKLHPDLISTFLTTGECDGIPEEVKLFLKQLQWASEVYEHERNISRAAQILQTRIQAQQKITLDVRTCKARIYAAINYFSIDNNVSIKVWAEDYANKYEDLAKIAAIRGDYRTMERCYDKANACRDRASEVNQADRQWAPVFIISPEIKPEDLGYSKRSLKEIARKNNDGYYIKLIENLPVEPEEKKRLRNDANIQDAEFTFEPNEE